LTSIEQDKIDLTCALRSAAAMGLHEGVCNHFSYAVDQQTFLINPQGLHWLELVPSDIVTVDANGNRIAGNRAVEPTAFFIHSRIHRAKPQARCIMHAHMPYATAIALLDGGRLEWCSQNAVRFFDRIGYDTIYNGLALDDAEGDRICGALKRADILFMANHGVLVCADTIANAFDDLYYLERAAMVQILAQSTGQKLRIIPDDVAARTALQHAQERQQSSFYLQALQRRLDQTDPGWADR